ncbi:MAG: rod-binding protein [Novosphingobium sp.]|nr:rod-binding protein [Novosphingobium sp.]
MISAPSTLTTVSTRTGQPQTEREQLAQAAQQFEAIFLRQFLASARKTDFGSDLFGGQAIGTFRQMQHEHFADIAAQTGAFGLAATIEAQLSRFVEPES